MSLLSKSSIEFEFIVFSVIAYCPVLYDGNLDTFKSKDELYPVASHAQAISKIHEQSSSLPSILVLSLILFRVKSLNHIVPFISLIARTK